MMGLPNWMHWVSWFLNAFLTSFVVIGLIVMLISVEFKDGYGALLGASSPSFFYFYFMMHASYLIITTFLICVFFENRKFLRDSALHSI